MIHPTPAELALAALMQQDGEEIGAILTSAVAAIAEREGREPRRTDATEGIGVLLAAAWTLVKLADANEDGGRAARYADLLRRHADSVVALG